MVLNKKILMFAPLLGIIPPQQIPGVIGAIVNGRGQKSRAEFAKKRLRYPDAQGDRSHWRAIRDLRRSPSRGKPGRWYALPVATKSFYVTHPKAGNTKRGSN